jgi:hypothetical protein
MSHSEHGDVVFVPFDTLALCLYDDNDDDDDCLSLEASRVILLNGRLFLFVLKMNEVGVVDGGVFFALVDHGLKWLEASFVECMSGSL